MSINLHVFIGAILLNSAMDIRMMECPAASKNLMVGGRLELQWKYNVEESARNAWKISLYVYNYTNKAKDKLVILHWPGKITARKSLPPTYQRLNLELSYDIARISIPTTTFDDTAGYGIAFEPTTGNNTAEPFQKVTDVTIVDMFLDEVESSTVVQTWIGQAVKFICTITLKAGADAPSFAWKNVFKNITITENIYLTRTKSILTIYPKSEDDFGSYKCYARTIYTTIKHNMTLLRIEYPGYPILINFSPQKRSLSWMAPTYDARGKRFSFTVQYLQDRATCNWIIVNKTSKLSISIHSLLEYFTGNIVARTCSVRVCSEGNGDSKNTSCSREHKVYSEISPAPSVRLTKDSSKKAKLSWERKNGDTVEILGYVVQMFHTSTYGKPTSIHVDRKSRQGQYTFNHLKKIKNALFRVCVRNTLCIYEQSCSRKVGLQPVFPSKPRSVQIKFKKNKNTSDANITWTEPRVKGKGTLFYVVEVQTAGKGKWKGRAFTTQLHATLTSPSMSDHIRVCAKNNVDNKNPKCSESYELGKAQLKNLETGSSGSSLNYAKNYILVILMLTVTAKSLCPA